MRAHPLSQLVLLDRPALKVGSSAVAFQSRKGQALLWYLAAHPGEAFPREHLHSLLWDDVPQQIARQNFNTMLFRFQRELPVPCLISTRNGLRWNDEAGVVIDTQRFQELTAPLAAFDRFRSRDAYFLLSEQERDDLAQAIELYHGPFLDGFSCDSAAYEQWLAAMRRQWESRVLKLFDLLLRVEEHHNRWDRVLHLSRKAIEVDPLDEAFHRAAIKALMMQNRYAAAVAQYRKCRELLWEHLGVAPDPETTALFDSICALKPANPSLVDVADDGAGLCAPSGEERECEESQSEGTGLQIEYPGDAAAFPAGIRRLIEATALVPRALPSGSGILHVRRKTGRDTDGSGRQRRIGRCLCKSRRGPSRALGRIPC